MAAEPRSTSPSAAPEPPVCHFEPKHRWSTKNNILTGVTLLPWLQILLAHGASIEWRTYAFRVVFLTFMACLNSLLAIVETLLYGKKIREATVNPTPVFILGHPRTGTTHLLNLLSYDERFYAPTTLQCGFASACLWLEPFSGLLNGVISKTRPMDNMALSMDVPQEDELAVNVLSACASAYAPIIFMTKEPYFRKFFTLENATDAERRRWIDAFMFFLRKITVRAGERRLLLKSPSHTAKVKLLLKLFPRAQFIYIHRDPYAVFSSAVNMADKTYWYNYLATPTDAQIQDFIVTQYETLYDAYMEARPLIPPGQLYEMAFADLEKDPLGELERAYNALGWSDAWQSANPIFSKYCKAQSGYRKNDLRITEAQRELVRRRWGPSFKTFGYPM